MRNPSREFCFVFFLLHSKLQRDGLGNLMEKKRKRKRKSCFVWVVVNGRDTWRIGSSRNFENEMYF